MTAASAGEPIGSQTSKKMATTLNPEKALIFRIVHRDNLPWILDHGLHASNGVISDPNYRNIGNVDLIGKRNCRHVRVGPGGTLSELCAFLFHAVLHHDVQHPHGI